MTTRRWIINTLMCVSLTVLVSCGDFQDIFGVRPQTSRTVDKVERKKSQSKKSAYKKEKAASKSGRDAKGVRAPITTDKGVYYFVAPGDKLTKIARRYKIDPMYLFQINELYDSKLVVGRRLFIPHKRNRHNYLVIDAVIAKNKSKRSGKKTKLKFIWPLKDFVVTSKFGWRKGRSHEGIDIAAKRGTPVMAAESGKVIYAKRFSTYGNLLVIKHAGNHFSAYAHLHRFSVKLGKKVKRGQKIGEVGRTGRASGDHVHFEIRKGSQALDPQKVISKRKK